MIRGAYYCTICGCCWRKNPPSDVQPAGSWSLWDTAQKPGKCCDNVAMGRQIKRYGGWWRWYLIARWYFFAYVVPKYDDARRILGMRSQYDED